MNKVEQVSKESMQRAQQMIASCFGEDVKGVHGRWAFLHKSQFDRQKAKGRNGYLYSHRTRAHSGVNGYEKSLSLAPLGGVGRFFSDGAKVAVVTDSQDVAKAISLLHKNVEVAFIDINEVARTGFQTGENKRRFDRIMVEDVGDIEGWKNLVKYLTSIAALGKKRNSTILRATDSAKKRLSAQTPEDMLSKLGWNIFIPLKNKKHSEIMVGFL